MRFATSPRLVNYYQRGTPVIHWDRRGLRGHAHDHTTRWTLMGSRRRCAAGTAAVPVETPVADNSRALVMSLPRLRYIVAAGPLIALAVFLTGCGAGAAPVVATPARAAPVPLVRLGAGVRGVQVLVEPDDGSRALTGAIRNAGRSIWLTMYMLTNRTIIHDLEYAHAAGVDVRVILEPHPYGASDNTNQSAYDALMAADIPVHWSSPRYRLTHEKSMVVDGDTAYIMTTNFTRASFQANREFDVVDRHPADVATVRALFVADWTNQVYTPRDGNLPLSPSDARPLLQALIGSARRTLDVYGEELQDPGMERALAAAARQGVRVRLILPAPSGPDYDATGVRLVTGTGVRVRRLPRSYLYIHAKAIVVDGRRAFVGSQNLSAASLDDNREVGIIVSDEGVIGTLKDTFDSDWSYRGG